MEKIDSKIIVEHRDVDKFQDSLEIGTAGKGGNIKVYGDFNQPDIFRNKIDEAIKLRQYVNTKIDEENKER
jgi:hypothetical protein